MNYYIQTALFISMYINISGLYEAALFLWVKAIFANGSSSICRLHLHSVAALYGCKNLQRGSNPCIQWQQLST